MVRFFCKTYTYSINIWMAKVIIEIANKKSNEKLNSAHIKAKQIVIWIEAPAENLSYQSYLAIGI